MDLVILNPLIKSLLELSYEVLSSLFLSIIFILLMLLFNFFESFEGLPFHQGVGSYGARFAIDKIYSTSFTRVAEAGSILFSVRAPVGRLNLTKNKIVIGRGLAAIKHKKGFQSYLFYMLKEKFFKENILGNGSIFASISKDELLKVDFIEPSRNIVKSYDDIVSSLDMEIMALDKQVQLLSEARDRLLPKLMSGELEV